MTQGAHQRHCQCRILVVDDNVDCAESMAAVLQLDGCVTRTAHSGGAALEAAAAFRPDAVLLDIGLPDIDGCEVAARLSRSAPGRKAVVVAMTGDASVDSPQRAAAAGVDHWLLKPVDIAGLANLLTSLIERAGNR